MLDKLETLIVESPAFALVIIFWIGAVASLTSCMAIRLPIVLGYVATSGDSKRRSLAVTFSFLVGMVVSYVLIGAAAAFVGGAVGKLLQTSKIAFWVTGTLLLVIGVLVSGLINPGSLSERWQKIAARLERMRVAGAILLGLLFGLLMMPACPLCGAGLIVLAGVVMTKSLSWYGLAMFASFALGQGLPVVAVGTLTALLRPGLISVLRKGLCSVDQHVQLLCGNVLVVLGIYFIVVG